MHGEQAIDENFQYTFWRSFSSAINLKGTACGILTERLKQSKPTNYSEIERLTHHLKLC